MTAGGTYACTQSRSSGTPGLAVHIADTSTHGISSEIVGRTEAMVLTNKTLTAPVIADFTNMAHDHLDADDGRTLSAAISRGASTRSGSRAAPRIAPSLPAATLPGSWW